MTRIVWLRHGRTAWNQEGRFQGQIDIPLDDIGQAQAERAASYLIHLEPSVIVSSDLERAVQTARPLADLAGISVSTDARLRETHAGSWQGLTHGEIREQFGPSLDQWTAGVDVRPGGGETRREVGQRVSESVAEYVDTHEGKTIVVVTHGGSARGGIGMLLGLPDHLWLSLGVLANCSWSIMAPSGHQPPAPPWRLTEYNAGSLPAPVLGDDR